MPKKFSNISYSSKKEEYEVKSIGIDPKDWKPYKYECDAICPYCGEETFIIALWRPQMDLEEFKCNVCGRIFTAHDKHEETEASK